MDIEKLLTSDNTTESIIELDKYICQLCAWGDELNKLTEPQQNFYFNQNLEREINNGGFNQYFYNSAGDFAHETIDSLKIIGATKTAEILQKAIEQFPYNTVPKDGTIRQDMVEEMEEVADEVWNELDQQFYKYEEDLIAMNIEYVRKNKDKF